MRFSKMGFLVVTFFFFISFITSCKTPQKNKFPDTEMYDLSNPTIINLPAALDEISGISYYSKDTSVFAEIDEDGILFKVPVTHPADFKQWRFDTKKDFEDIVLSDSVFYLLVSNGDIETVKFKGDSLYTTKSNFYTESVEEIKDEIKAKEQEKSKNNSGKKGKKEKKEKKENGEKSGDELKDKPEKEKKDKTLTETPEEKKERHLEKKEKKLNEFEGLFKTDSGTIVLVCKSCESDDKKRLSLYTFNYKDSAKSYTKLMSFDLAPIVEKLGDENIKIKPSAAAINPITKDLYILNSTGLQFLMIFSPEGKFKEVFKLDPVIYKQPEGLTFTPAGDLIISNESHKEGSGQLLIMKNKKKKNG